MFIKNVYYKIKSCNYNFISLKHSLCSRPGPNLNTLCDQYSDASPISKSHQKFVCLKSSKKTFEQGYPGGLFPFWSSEVPFSNISALFIPVNITIIFYSFLLVRITFLPWQIIMQTLKLFTFNGYYMISHWKIKQICFSVHLFWTFS